MPSSGTSRACSRIVRLAAAREGVTTVEYALVGAVLATVILAAFSGMAPSLGHAIDKVVGSLSVAGG